MPSGQDGSSAPPLLEECRYQLTANQQSKQSKEEIMWEQIVPNILIPGQDTLTLAEDQPAPKKTANY